MVTEERVSTGITPETLIYGLRTAASPTISPDGAWIVYSRSESDRDRGRGISHLWLVRPDGSDERPLTTSGITNAGPAWSPDGASIAYVSKDDADLPHSIRIIPVDGGESRELTRHRSAPSALAWSPDARTLAYTVSVDPENPGEAPADEYAPCRCASRAGSTTNRTIAVSSTTRGSRSCSSTSKPVSGRR